jgi:hypothetical protein
MPPGNPRFKESLAHGADEVRWGLPEEYIGVVSEALVAQPVSVAISRAAAGQVGSSAKVFRTLAAVLCRVLGGDLPQSDEDLWRLWDRYWNAA